MEASEAFIKQSDEKDCENGKKRFDGCENLSSSYAFLAENKFTLVKSKYGGNRSLLKGPRRVLLFCLLGVLLPVILITIPVYAKVALYSRQSYVMAPTDQRLLNKRVSSIWCQGQTVHMNGSFNAFKMISRPMISGRLQRHEILNNLTLQDDVKEYWGFYLIKGSRITLTSCMSHFGGILTVIRGTKNLFKCAWIGEEDSAEADEVDSSEEAEIDGQDQRSIKLSNSSVTQRANETLIVDPYGIEDAGAEGNEESGVLDGELNFHSTERRRQMKALITKLANLSKHSTEVLDLWHMYSVTQKFHDSQAGFNGQSFSKDSPVDSRDKTFQSDKNVHFKEKLKLFKDSNYRKYNSKDNRIDMQFKSTLSNIRTSLRNETYKEGKQKTIVIEGYSYEKGTINQTDVADKSKEEHKSSFSSSEEALASCEGVIVVENLDICLENQNYSSDKVGLTFTVDKTGVYYLIFSSDNELVVNNLFFNITLQRVIFDTSDSMTTCLNMTDCSMQISFWSQEQTVVEVPFSNDWKEYYLLDSNCEPRVAVYLIVIFFAPVLIVFFALK